MLLEVSLIRIAIVDDQTGDREKLRCELDTCLNRNSYDELVIDCFGSGEEFLNSFVAGKYDIVFLDIMMTGISGIETGRKLRESDDKAHLVFITTSNDFAAESYQLKADHYLLKPFSSDEIRQMLERLDINDLRNERAAVFPDGTRVMLGSIVCTEYYKHVIHISLKDGHEVRIRMAQHELEEILCGEPQFYSCIRGVIVNFAEVERIDRDTVVMKNGRNFSLSRSKRHEAETAFADYLFQNIRSRPVH
jgi:DNA-binding LytR/AlgR family response regulator